MIIVRDKELDKVKLTDCFIDVITNETAIAYLKHVAVYEQSSDQIKLGLTKQDNQYYYFEHDIISTPRTTLRNQKSYGFAYRVYPITNLLADRIISQESVGKWEVFFDSYLNYQCTYLMVKDYGLHFFEYKGSIDATGEGKLIIPYNISPSDFKGEGQTIEDFFYQHARRYALADILELNPIVIREMKLKELGL